MSSGLRKFGYCYGEIERDTLIGKKGTVVVGHEFHHSVFNSQEPTVLKMTKKEMEKSSRNGQVAIKRKILLGVIYISISIKTRAFYRIYYNK